MTRMLTAQGMAIFCTGAMAGMMLTLVGVWLALKCLEWRGLW